MLTSPESTFLTTISKCLNHTRQSESYMPGGFPHFVNTTISGTEYFHKVVWQHILYCKFSRESAGERILKIG